MGVANAWAHNSGRRCVRGGAAGLGFPRPATARRGGRVDECAGLENRISLTRDVGSNPTPSASFEFSGFRQRPTMDAESGRATRDRFSSRATGRLRPTTRRRTSRSAGPGGSGRSRTGRDVTRQTPRFSGDFPKSVRPSVRQSRREALCSPVTNRPKRFATATRLAPRPPDPLRFPPPDSDPQK